MEKNEITMVIEHHRIDNGKMSKSNKVEGPKSNPPPLNVTEAYHRARRSYGLFSGLLILWELIGVEVKENPFQNFNVILKSPEALPYVLIALVFYFGFRITIEWYQCDPARRAMKSTRIDLYVAHFLGCIAIGLYIIQRLLDLQIADQFDKSTFQLGALCFFLGFQLADISTSYKSYRKKGLSHNWIGITKGILLFFMLLFVLAAVVSYPLKDSLFLLGATLGGGGVKVSAKYFVRRKIS